MNTTEPRCQCETCKTLRTVRAIDAKAEARLRVALHAAGLLLAALVVYAVHAIFTGHL